VWIKREVPLCGYLPLGKPYFKTARLQVKAQATSSRTLLPPHIIVNAGTNA
jgi:hypothetical protein